MQRYLVMKKIIKQCSPHIFYAGDINHHHPGRGLLQSSMTNCVIIPLRGLIRSYDTIHTMSQILNCLIDVNVEET